MSSCTICNKEQTTSPSLTDSNICNECVHNINENNYVFTNVNGEFEINIVTSSSKDANSHEDITDVIFINDDGNHIKSKYRR